MTRIMVIITMMRDTIGLAITTILNTRDIGGNTVVVRTATLENTTDGLFAEVVVPRLDGADALFRRTREKRCLRDILTV